MSDDGIYADGSFVPGTVYRVLREIGAGGMGRVYEVEDVTVGKRYALKTLLDVRVRAREAALRMALESRALVRIGHPNVVDVVTAGVARDGAFYYVMELLQGTTLRAILAEKRRLELRHALPVALGVAAALERAHAEGVIHRDVKPDNVFVARTGRRGVGVKVLDFGVAGFRDRLGGLEQDEGLLVGTPCYASPEQQRGESPAPSMDVWSTGVLMFETVVGRKPFPDGSVTHALAAVQGPEAAPRVEDALPGVPPALAELVAAMLDKNPSRRPGSMRAVHAELRAIARALSPRQGCG